MIGKEEGSSPARLWTEGPAFRPFLSGLTISRSAERTKAGRVRPESLSRDQEPTGGLAYGSESWS